MNNKRQYTDRRFNEIVNDYRDERIGCTARGLLNSALVGIGIGLVLLAM